MSSGSLSYGTVQIGVRDASRLKSGDQYTYKIISGQGTDEGGDVDATKINGIIYLLDSQYTIGENDPPYTVNSGIMFLDSNGNTAAITEILTVSNYGHGNDGKDDDIILPPDDPGDKDGDDDTSSFEPPADPAGEEEEEQPTLEQTVTQVSLTSNADSGLYYNHNFLSDPTQYTGLYHVHGDGTLEAGAGSVDEPHDPNPNQVLIQVGPNPIVQTQLSAGSDDNLILQSTLEPYTGPYHIHQDNTMEIGNGLEMVDGEVVVEQHNIDPEKVLINSPDGNYITEVNLEAQIVYPSEFVYALGAELEGQAYYGLYHKHLNGQLMIGGGELGAVHDLNPNELITTRNDYNQSSATVAANTFTIDERLIKETFSDLVYGKWFSSLDEEYANSTFYDMTQGGGEVSIDLNLNTLQTTIRDGQIVTGRQDDETLVFYKKDRNTPENRKDLTDGKLSEVINDISMSFVDNGVVDLSTFISNKITVLSELSDTEEPISEEQSTAFNLQSIIDDINNAAAQESMTGGFQVLTIDNFKIRYVKYKLRYRNGETKIDIPFGDLLHVINNLGPEEDDLYLRQWYYYEWSNVLNLSQLTTPITGQRINPEKANEVLDTNIFELLPPQSTRQDQIDAFFQEFTDLIGPEPNFLDIDSDGIGESIQNETTDIQSRISFENKREALITRLDAHLSGSANGNKNINKTLESMRNRLNRYLADVDNVIQEVPEQRPEYENKSEGFLKIRKPNQAIILRAPNDGELEFQKNDSYLTDGFTITMWVRFVSKISEGTLFNFGNPEEDDGKGIRLETRTNIDTSGNYRRWIRLAVRDDQGILRDNHFGTETATRRTANQTGPLEHYASSFFHQLYPQISTDNLDEWYFICATYNPNINELNIGSNSPLRRSKQYWLNHLNLPYISENNPSQENINEASLVSNSGLGAKCKVEIISKSELLRARGFAVDLSIESDLADLYEAQQSEEELNTETLTGNLTLQVPGGTVWGIDNVNDSSLLQFINNNDVITFIAQGSTEDFTVDGTSGNPINTIATAESVPNDGMGTSYEFSMEVVLPFE